MQWLAGGHTVCGNCWGPLSLANRNGADHKARRRVVGQLFTTAALKRSSPAIVALVDGLAEELLGDQLPVALVPKLRRFAFSVIASTVLGLDPVDREALFMDFEIWCQGLMIWRPFGPSGISTTTKQ
jgi:cytochrome P450